MPIYETMPQRAQDYVLRLEELSGAPISYIGEGPGRDQTIVRQDVMERKLGLSLIDDLRFYTNKDEIEKSTNPADNDSKPSEGDDVKDTTPPTVNPIAEGDKTISGTGDRPDEKIIVELLGGKTVETKTDNQGNWKVEIPSGTTLEPGDEIKATDKAGNEATAKVGIDVATVAGGLALIAAGILAGTLIYNNCSPNGGSSVKDLELKGSSGKTSTVSSKKSEETTPEAR